ncbi:MAG: malate dehydrogenase [Actinobacteria bacterium]|nr:malate dehydrogenase [Actinomycetota bacterium]
MNPRVCIIGGGGTVGSAAAFRLAALGIAEEVVLLDARANMAQSHAMDLEQAASVMAGTGVRAGTWEDLAGAGIVIFAAGLPERNVASRDEYLAGNLSIVREAAGHVASLCPDAVVIVATNPVDVFTAAFAKLTGIDDRHVLGYSLNDTLRLRWAVARVLGESARDVEALVLGEHGEMQVPLFDRISVRGRPVVLTAGQEREADVSIRSWFTTYQGLNSGRTSGWTSAVGLATVVGAIVEGGSEILPASAVLHGEYGVTGVSLGVPVRLGSRGVEEVVELPLTAAQSSAFHAAARKIGELLDGVMGTVGGQGGESSALGEAADAGRKGGV